MVPSKAVAKRSPILGYNHNVRYRGLVFHVQTEDSGVLSPHLFTHLFHGGVIVSTRKLVYDAGASPEAIKALMQAQHKAVLKDLNKGAFDQKIDQYLGGTPGLEPRNPALVPAAVAAPEPDAATDAPEVPAAATVPNAAAAAAVPEVVEEGNDTQVRRRMPRDTIDDPTIASRLGSEPAIELTKVRVPAPSAPPQIATPAPLPSKPPQSAATLGAAASRPGGPGRSRNDSDPAQIYSPPPAADEQAPAQRIHITGQYSAKRPSGNIPVALHESRSQSGAQLSSPTVRGVEPAAKPSGGGPAVSPPPASPGLAVPRTATLPARSPLAKSFANPVPPVRDSQGSPAKSPVAVPPQHTPQKSIPASTPMKAGSPGGGAPGAASNVVMTRPAVVVGGSPPAGRKLPATPAPGAIQGLISEKSLDEVIHAYLSDDGEET